MGYEHICKQTHHYAYHPSACSHCDFTSLVFSTFSLNLGHCQVCLTSQKYLTNPGYLDTTFTHVPDVHYLGV